MLGSAGGSEISPRCRSIGTETLRPVLRRLQREAGLFLYSLTIWIRLWRERKFPLFRLHAIVERVLAVVLLRKTNPSCGATRPQNAPLISTNGTGWQGGCLPRSPRFAKTAGENPQKALCFKGFEIRIPVPHKKAIWSTERPSVSCSTVFQTVSRRKIRFGRQNPQVRLSCRRSDRATCRKRRFGRQSPARSAKELIGGCRLST